MLYTIVYEFVATRPCPGLFRLFTPVLLNEVLKKVLVLFAALAL